MSSQTTTTLRSELPDYYQILAVGPGCSDEELRSKYLSQAARLHPARGGSHERMLQIAEAWEVLSHAESRKRFDVAQKAPDASTISAAIKDRSIASRAAANYPRCWGEFVRQSFSFADRAALPPRDQIYAGAAIVGGAALFFAPVLLVLLYLDSVFALSTYLGSALIPKLLGLALLPLGARFGWRTYLRLLTAKENSNASTLRTDGRDIIACPNCAANLKATAATRGLRVKCPKCGTTFANGKRTLCRSPANGKVLRILVLLYVLLVLADMLIPWRHFLPLELRDWQIAQEQQLPASTAAIVLGGALLIVLAIHIASLVGLFLFKRWGFWAFAVTIILLLACGSLQGPKIYVGVQDAFESLMPMTIGAIIALGGLHRAGS